MFKSKLFTLLLVMILLTNLNAGYAHLRLNKINNDVSIQPLRISQNYAIIDIPGKTPNVYGRVDMYTEYPSGSVDIMVDGHFYRTSIDRVTIGNAYSLAPLINGVDNKQEVVAK